MLKLNNPLRSKGPSQIAIAFNGQYVEVSVKGHFDRHTANEMWSRALETCKTNRCTRILGIANTDLQVSRMEVAQQGKLFDKIGITHEYRIAWVEQGSPAYDAAYNIETVLLNRGFKARLFEDAEEACDWLLGGR